MTNVSTTTPQNNNSFPSAVIAPNQPTNYGAVKKREPLLGVVVGRKAVGKTYTTNKLIYLYVTGQLSQDAHPRKVLILDINDEYNHIKAISLNDIPRFSGNNIIEARRVRIFKESGGKMSLSEIVSALNHILLHFKDGLLLIEDINKYISDSLPNDLIGAICTQRHTGCDIVIHFQGIGRITPKIWQNCNYVRFHKNNESVEVHKDKFPDKEEPLKILEAMVNAEVKRGIALNGEEKGARFFAYYDVEYEQIKGEYSQKMLWDSIMIYLEQNYNRIIKPLVSGVDLNTGKPKPHDIPHTVKTVVTKLFRQYYGNGQTIPV